MESKLENKRHSKLTGEQVIKKKLADANQMLKKVDKTRLSVK